MSDLRGKISDWLKKSGYPLEMSVARSLQSAGFGVVQSEYYEDAESAKWREIDVIGYEEHTGKTCRTIFALIAECKGGGDRPWVIFTSNDLYPDGLGVSRRASSKAGQSVLDVLTIDEKIQKSILFTIPPRPGYGLTVALRDGNKQDAAYDALQSVSRAANGIVARLEQVPHQSIIPFAWPVIVTGAPLFECYLGSDGEMQIDQVEKGVLVWRNPLVTRHTIIQIYTKDKFFSEASHIRVASLAFLEAATAEHDRSPRLSQTDKGGI